MSRLPNLLTGMRLALALFTFFGLAGATLLSEQLTPASQFGLERWAFWAFVVAALTDFFDGWLARRLHAVTLWGAILDPIADKVLVCGAILGLLTLGPNAAVAIPAALILFREFTVSALREVAAGKGVSLPVTLLAKWKTTLQLTALGSELLVACWAAFSLPNDPAILGPATLGAHGLLWIAALITLVTGAQYWEHARVALTTSERAGAADRGAGE
jgi:CDP-diacylglycerol--glycerol-3-phosphate 3-phosphatidyltransferase